ncbi:hypothetical protein [Pseudomonas oryzihabitans]
MVLGVGLILGELLLHSFVLLGFGVGALLVGILLLVLPGLVLAWQLLA